MGLWITRSDLICWSPSGTAPGLQEEPISGSALAAAMSPDFELSAAAILSVSFRSKIREGKRADLTFADQTFANGHFTTSYYKSPLDREEGPVGP